MKGKTTATPTRDSRAPRFVHVSTALEFTRDAKGKVTSKATRKGETYRRPR